MTLEEQIFELEQQLDEAKQRLAVVRKLQEQAKQPKTQTETKPLT